MLKLLSLLLLAATRSEAPPETWNCSNQIELWCATDGCVATPPGEFTPMDIWASVDGAISVCAYSGCWQGKGAVSSSNGRLLWTADNLPFVSATEGAAGDATLLILKADGVGFVRAGGIATPVLCTRAMKLESE